jgi:hypothetical protein
MSSSTRSIRRTADQVVHEALGDALTKVFATAAPQRVFAHVRSGTMVKAYLRAVRRQLEWMEACSHF